MCTHATKSQMCVITICSGLLRGPCSGNYLLGSYTLYGNGFILAFWRDVLPPSSGCLSLIHVAADLIGKKKYVDGVGLC
jgi:hypothetical protein